LIEVFIEFQLAEMVSCHKCNMFRSSILIAVRPPFPEGGIYLAAEGELRAPEASRSRSGRPTVTGSQIGPPRTTTPV